MFVISIIQQKGGVGKTTLAINLNAAYKKLGWNSAILDADPQKSTTHLTETMRQTLNKPGQNARVLNSDNGYNFSELAAKFPKVEMCIVDTPPYQSVISEQIIKQSDFILVPTKPSLLDYNALSPTIHQIEQYGDQTPGGIVFTMVKQSSRLSLDMKEIFETYNFPILETKISERVSYKRSLVTTGSVVNQNADWKAKREIMGLAKEISERILANEG